VQDQDRLALHRRDVPVIQVVDDAALTRRAIRGILERAGFEVHEAATGGEALALAPALRPDLIMLDIELPDIGGLEVARHLKELDTTSRIPVIHLSATRVSGHDLVRGLDAGADAYLVHPVDEEVLLSTIRALLRIKSTVERVAALQALTAALSSATTPLQIAEALLGAGLLAAGADGCVLATASTDGAWLDVVGASPAWPIVLSGNQARVSLTTPAPLSICAWTGEPLWIASRASLAADYPHLAGPELASRASLAAVACLPLTFDACVRGAVGFSFASERPFGDVTRSFLLTIATECAHALERIHLHEAERRARQDAERAAVHEREARLAQGRVEAALRVSIRAREDMLAIVSHDLRNPLSAVMMNADLSKSRLAAGKLDRAIEGMDAILVSAERMNTLINDLLDAASIESGLFTLHLEPCPLDDLVNEVLDMLQHLAAQRTIALRGMITGRPVAVCDRKRVLQILSNLVGNAIKFTPVAGTVVVRAAIVGDHVDVIVSDSGPGITDENLPHLFDRYWKGHARDSGGAGLGLFIVKGLVEAHGGHVAVTSQPGKGTDFSFSLPAHPPSPAPA
jgi:signal transduction histidine kinase/CheY-like chemotaxis protein